MAVNQQSPKKRFVEKMGDEDKEDSAFASILKIDQGNTRAPYRSFSLRCLTIRPLQFQCLFIIFIIF